MARRKARYLGILRGSDEAARNLLIGYFKGDRKVTYPSKQVNRPATSNVYVDLFDFPVAAGAKILEKVNSSRIAAVSGFMGGRYSTVAPGSAENIIDVPGFYAPRASIVTQRSSTTGNRNTSKLTGKEYKSYGGQGISVPFGPATENESVDEAFGEILAAVKAASALNTCSLVPGSYVK